MLKVTVQAIQGQAGPAGRPKAAITARFGNPAPMTRAATAAFESRRDFTHAFQVACRNALAIIARKTVRGSFTDSGPEPLRACFGGGGNRGPDAAGRVMRAGGSLEELEVVGRQ